MAHMTNQYKQLFLQILERYRLGTASADELDFLEKYYSVFEANDDAVFVAAKSTDVSPIPVTPKSEPPALMLL